MSNDGMVGGSEGNNDGDDYERIKLSLEGRMDKKDEETLKIEANVFQLANYYFVFQGVFLTSILKDSSTLTCKYIWVPLSLSIIGSVLNLGALLIIGDKYKESLQILDKMASMLHGHIRRPWYVASKEKQVQAAQAQVEVAQAQTQALENAEAQTQAALDLATQGYQHTPVDTQAQATHVQTPIALAQAQAALAQAQAALAPAAEAQEQAQPQAVQAVGRALALAQAALDDLHATHQANPQAPESIQAGASTQATLAQLHALAVAAMRQTLELVQNWARAQAAEEEYSLALANALETELEEAKISADKESQEVWRKHKMKELRRTRIWVLSMVLFIFFGLINLVAIVIIPCRI